MKIKAFVFDVDGTLFSSDEIVAPAYFEAVKTFNAQTRLSLLAPTAREVLDKIGKPAPVILKNLFPDITQEQQITLGQSARSHLIRLILEGGARLYPGVLKTLYRLKSGGIALKTASNGNPDYLDAIYSYYGLYEFFGEVMSIYDAGLKDKGDILLRYQERLNLMPEEMVMVGDRLSDLEAAKKAGCRFIGVAYGHGGASELHGTFPMLDQFDKLPALIASGL